jgi:hypothetical protein
MQTARERQVHLSIEIRLPISVTILAKVQIKVIPREQRPYSSSTTIPWRGVSSQPESLR